MYAAASVQMAVSVYAAASVQLAVSVYAAASVQLAVSVCAAASCIDRRSARDSCKLSIGSGLRFAISA